MKDISNTRFKLGYLSAALRVSTHPEAEAGGPRSHVLGVIGAFKELGWIVKPYIVGDRMPQRFLSSGAGKTIGRSFWRILVADFIRLGFGLFNRYKAWYELGTQVDLVYERFAVLQVLGHIFKKHGKYWILETSGPFFYEAKEERNVLVLTGLARQMEINAYQSCDLLVCVSSTLKEIIIREANISEDKIVVLPNGVDTTFFDPENNAPKIIFSGFTIGYVGSLLAWQGLDYLLKSVAQLLNDGVDINIVIIGDGPELDNLTHLTKTLNIDSHVKFLGLIPRNDIPGYIAGFDIGYSGQLPLKIGGMYHSPLKIYEYMAMAKPVIASDFEDARRIIEDRKTGFLFKARDENSLQKAIIDAYHSEHLVNMGYTGRELIIKHHSWKNRISYLIDLVENKQTSTKTDETTN